MNSVPEPAKSEFVTKDGHVMIGSSLSNSAKLMSMCRLAGGTERLGSQLRVGRQSVQE